MLVSNRIGSLPVLVPTARQRFVTKAYPNGLILQTGTDCSQAWRSHTIGTTELATRDYGSSPKDNVFMTFFRPDQDQVSTFKFRNIHECQICFDECGASRLVAQPGCCRSLVHLDCFNTLANSASKFLCPKCDRELSGESVRAVCRRTNSGTGRENKEEEIILGSMATTNITAPIGRHGKEGCGSQDNLHHRQETSQPSSDSSSSSESINPTSSFAGTNSGRRSQPPRNFNKDCQTLTFFLPFEEMERNIIAERERNSQSGKFFSWLLIWIGVQRQE